MKKTQRKIAYDSRVCLASSSLQGYVPRKEKVHPVYILSKYFKHSTSCAIGPCWFRQIADDHFPELFSVKKKSFLYHLYHFKIISISFYNIYIVLNTKISSKQTRELQIEKFVEFMLKLKLKYGNFHSEEHIARSPLTTRHF